MDKIERNKHAGCIAEELGVTTATVGNYVRLGMPHDEGYIGTKRVRTFNVEECKAWFKARREGK